ncbi:MAG: hypothetical protein LKG27_00860 [Clostridiaceae bacterium]|jgi:tetratricopeptide (TPR) repeat protein|nr:hypothetical protein [Clostridiaceae bacterium]
MTEDYKSLLDDGIFAIQDGKFENGIDFINRSIEIKSDWEIPYFYRAVAYQALEKWDDASLDYTKAIQLNDKMIDAYYNRARIVLVRKDIENPNIQNAIKDLDIAIKLDENFIDALYAMAAAQKKIGEYEVAIKYLNKILFLEPEAVNARAFKKLLLQKYIK